jgi:hypothetical protein
MLKAVYPAIKAANPAVQVLHGSLLLDHPYDPVSGGGLSARFLEGVFVAGAANSFDILPYNLYYWGQDLDKPDWKTPYLRNLMQVYGVPLKPMIITEQGILCDPACPLMEAYSIGRYYARAVSYNLLGGLWYIYDSDAFHNTALVDPQDITKPRPAYHAYKHAASLLKDATAMGPLETLYPGVEGYRFARPGGGLVVLWSSKAQPVAIQVAHEATVSCSAWDGAPLPCSNTAGIVRLTADRGPIYVVAQ